MLFIIQKASVSKLREYPKFCLLMGGNEISSAYFVVLV
jgi:hypothetical protein